jgi:teichuronic acid biosynthesis glycosyltransferase TuaC
VRALVVSNMLPDERHPERGRFVRDQVDALRGLPDLEVELYEFAPGPRNLLAAARALRAHARARGARLDVVHAHFGLTAWPALAVPARVRGLTVHGTDVRDGRTREATRAVLPLMALVGAVSQELLGELPGRAARARARVLPCGVDLERFRPLPRAQARTALGLEPAGRYLLFPADPARASKRYDRALALTRALAADGAPRLLTLGGVAPDRVPLLVNAADAVVIPSEHEGFGLAALEALACDVPVLATPVGIHPRALQGVAGALCAPFGVAHWQTALAVHLAHADPRIEGRAHAEPFSAAAMAARLAAAWRAALGEDDGRDG